MADPDKKPEPDDRSSSGAGKSRSPWGSAGLALMIPSIMAASPFAGYLIGSLLQRWTGWGDWVVAVFIFLGLAAGVRQVIQIVRRLS